MREQCGVRARAVCHIYLVFINKLRQRTHFGRMKKKIKTEKDADRDDGILIIVSDIKSNKILI